MDTTALVIIGSIISIASLILAILKMSRDSAHQNQKFLIEQAVIQEKLSTITKELLEIKQLLSENEGQIQKNTMDIQEIKNMYKFKERKI